jgi:hypothetical protein
MANLPRSHSHAVYNPRRSQGKARAKETAPAFLSPNCSSGADLRHRAVMAIFYALFDHGMLIDHLPRSRAGREVRPAFCVNDRLRRLARISRLRDRPAYDKIIKLADE